MVTTSIQEYEVLSQRASCTPDVWGNLACCYFMLGMYAEADSATEKCELCLFPHLAHLILPLSSSAPKGRLQNRLHFHLAHKVTVHVCIWEG